MRTWKPWSGRAARSRQRSHGWSGRSTSGGRTGRHEGRLSAAPARAPSAYANVPRRCTARPWRSLPPLHHTGTASATPGAPCPTPFLQTDRAVTATLHAPYPVRARVLCIFDGALFSAPVRALPASVDPVLALRRRTAEQPRCIRDYSAAVLTFYHYHTARLLLRAVRRQAARHHAAGGGWRTTTAR